MEYIIKTIADLKPSRKGIKIYAQMPDGSDHMFFYRNDGLFAVCKTIDGHSVYPVVTTPIIKVKDGFAITYDTDY